MKNGSFKTIKIATITALIASAAAILLVCFVPRILISKLYDNCRADLENAVTATLAENNAEAYVSIERICERLEDSSELLMIFYDHNKVIELTGSAEAALELAKTKDTAQLLVELHDIEKAFECLIHLNDAGLYNVF